MIDTHTHLNHSDFADDLPETVTHARNAGVVGMVVVGYDLPSSREALLLADHYDGLHATVGVHPHSASECDPGVLAELGHLATEPRVVAIGEVGLDFFRDLSPRLAQREAFRRLVALAAETQLPLVIHNRDAHEEILAILAEETTPESVVIMHCFSGDRDFANECRERSYYLGVAGPLTYPKSELLREIVAAYPGKRLLLETDCPWLAPQAYRGQRNEPSRIPEIAAALAELRGDSLVRVIAQTTENAQRAFRLSPEARR